ncbi:MAG: histidine kinase [Candidatus Thiothrix sulfatifontis]|nr:MAG: histidine kinase [Candidatus Thiothrix sulfatifontis]
MKWIKRVSLGMLLSSAMWSSVSATEATAKTPLIFGFSTDAAPISYLSSEGRGNEVKGFCSHFLAFLRAEQYDIPPENLRPLAEPSKRFENFAGALTQKQIGIQCGPSSRTTTRIEEQRAFNGEFSEPFFIARTRLLIRRDKINALHENPAQLTIGVLKGSDNSPVTNESAIRSFFPSATINNTFSERGKAITSLLSTEPNSIDAYAGDDVVLFDILNKEVREGGKFEQYSIESPPQGYSREEYSIVIYNAPRHTKDAPSLLKEKIDFWIQSDKAKQAVIQALTEKNIPVERVLFDADHFKAAEQLAELSLVKQDVLSDALKVLLLAEPVSAPRLLIYGLLLMAILGGLIPVYLLMRKPAKAVSATSGDTPLQRLQAEKQIVAEQLKQLSMDLHDNVKQDLVGAKTYTELAINNVIKNPEACSDYLQKLLAVVKTSIDDVREISHVIDKCANGETTHQDKLHRILEDFQAKAELNAITVIRDVQINLCTLPESVADTVFIIAREALHNIEKYAVGVTRVLVQLDKEPNAIQLIVKDDGKGLEAEQLKNAQGKGIKNMRERTERLGGQFFIDGKMGVTIRVLIPVTL